MKNPKPVNLMTPEESRARGWKAESRDNDGHLVTQHAAFDSSLDLLEYVYAENARGMTVTIWPDTLSAKEGE